MTLDLNHMMQYIKRLTRGRFVYMLAAAMSLTACEKNIDNTIPPDANKFSNDIKTAFENLTHEEKLWFWELKSPLTNGHLMSAFYKDSTVESYLMQRYTLNNQLALLANTAPLTNAEWNEVVQLYNTYAAFSDAEIRSLLESPANLSFKNRTLKYLPNYPNFNGYYRLTLADQATFDINGPVQLSLTINNSTLMSNLRQTRQLDYDFRIFSNTKDIIVLSGYYANSSNKDCRLIPMANADAVPMYANGSALFMSALHQRANVSVKVDGNTVTVPSKYRSGIDWFYRNFKDGIMNKTVNEFSFEALTPPAADMPDAFKDISFATITAYYNGTYAAAPVGTAIVTMAGYTSSGSKKVIEFIK